MIRYAKITEVTEHGFFVTFLGETEQSQMQYKKLESYTPSPGDMVAIFEDSHGKKLIIGKVG